MGTGKNESEIMQVKGKMIDLSQEIYTGMPVYPGHAKTVMGSICLTRNPDA